MRPTFTSARFWLHHPREWLALLLLVLLQCSCTTLAHRRDLYSPEPAPNAMPPVTRVTTTTTTQVRTGRANRKKSGRCSRRTVATLYERLSNFSPKKCDGHRPPLQSLDRHLPFSQTAGLP